MPDRNGLRNASPGECAAEIKRLRERVLLLEEVIAVAKGVCGQNHCNCPGAPRVKEAFARMEG